MRLSLESFRNPLTNFNPRTPYGMRPYDMIRFHQVLPYFNPRTPYGMRLWWSKTTDAEKDFNPRTPYGMRHMILLVSRKLYQFQSTHPLRDATQYRLALP